MKKVLIPLIVLAFLILPVWAQQTVTLPMDPAAPREIVTLLEKITGDIAQELTLFRDANRESAEALSETGISGEKATAILDAKLAKAINGESSLIISPEGIVTAASPSRYSGIVGTDLSYQSAVQYANSEKRSIISDIFPLEEGFSGISMSYPIFSTDNQYLGYTDITIRPEKILRQIVLPIAEQTGFDIFVIQKDGLSIYDVNEEEIGKNLLSDPLYDTPDMRNVSRAIIDNQSGIVRYTFWDRFMSRQVPRQATWTTLSTDSQEWRIGVVRNLDESEHEPAMMTGTETKPGNLNTSITDLNRFVSDAADYARINGRKAACESFNNLSGPYVSDSRYIFAYDMNGTILALPYQQGLIGMNRMNLTDGNGFKITPAVIDLAKKGGGVLYFVYPNPTDGFEYQLKLVQVEPIGSDWLIGSGIYLPWIEAEINSEEISALIARVKNAVSHADKVGKKQAIADFNDLDGVFADKELYIFAYDYDGITRALPYQPQIIGTNRTDYTDIYQCRIITQEIDAAKRGGGFVYIVYYNPETGKNELKLCYVLPAGDDWLIGSGIYTGTGLE